MNQFKKKKEENPAKNKKTRKRCREKINELKKMKEMNRESVLIIRNCEAEYLERIFWDFKEFSRYATPPTQLILFPKHTSL